MITNESEKKIENVCDLKYLNEMMGGKKHLIKGVMDVFLLQIPEELKCINDAVKKINYATIKSNSHTMKSSVSIMGISCLATVLHEMEVLGETATDIEKIIELNHKLNLVCMKAIDEIEREKLNYV